jgi:uncharacterized LabA/DUF88 family protein
VRAIVFIDYENIWSGLFSRGYELTPEKLMEFLQQYGRDKGFELSAIYLYANFDREEFWRTQTSFEKTNVFTRHVFSKNNYTNTDYRRNATDLELMLEAQEILLTRTATFESFLLLTGDGDFLPLARKVRAWGKKVRVVGVQGSIHARLRQYSEDYDAIEEILKTERDERYLPEDDLEQAVRMLGQMQLRMAYIASTKARALLGEQLGRTLSQVKQLIALTLSEEMLTQREHSDPGLKIGRTKIYLLNLEHPRVKRWLWEHLNELRQSYEKLAAL